MMAILERNPTVTEYQVYPWLFLCLCQAHQPNNVRHKRRMLYSEKTRKLLTKLCWCWLWPCTLFFLINLFLMTCLEYVFFVFILLFLPFLSSLPSCLNLIHSSRPVQLLPITTQPPHSELRIPTWVPVTPEKWLTYNVHLIIVLPAPLHLLYKTVGSSRPGMVCFIIISLAPPTQHLAPADN